MERSSSSSNGGVILTRERKGFESPFTLKVGQVFTGFGIGCGVGIGVGRPINLSAVPMVGQMMSSARGATDALSGVTRHVNNALRKVGANNVQAGIGCGVGFGHGFGVGLAVKPGVVHKIQSCLVQMTMKLMTKLGISPNLPIAQGALPASLQSSLGMMSDPSNQNSPGSIMQMPMQLPDHTTQGLSGLGNMGLGSLGNMGPGPLGNIGPGPLGNIGPGPLGNMGSGPLGNMSPGSSYGSISSKTTVDTAFGSQTEKVLSSFLQNPLLKDKDAELNQVAQHLRSENNMLQMVLKHQQVIENLMEENDKLRRILLEDLKVPPSKLQVSYSSTSKSPCSDCFECRRKQRRK